MSQQINDNFQLLAGLPMDDRIQKPTIAERDAISLTRRFQGLKCFVVQTQTEYQLLGGVANSNWVGIAGANVSNAIETIIEGFYVLVAGKETLLDWEVGDKFRGWIGNRYLVGTILSLPVSLPSDIDNVSKVELSIDSNGNLKSYNGNKTTYNSKRKAVFTFIWDDVQTSDPLVYNVFQEYGYIPSYAIMTNNLNSGNVGFYIDAYQKGASILAHSVSHPNMSGTSLTNAQVNTQMVDSKNIIEGYGMRVSGWVTPSSILNPIYYPQVDKNFGYGFTETAGLYNETVDPLRLSRVGLELANANHNFANVQSIIDDAIANNKMIAFYGHKLPSTYLNGDSTPYLTEADLRAILAYLKTKSDENLCEVLPTDEAIDTYYGLNAISGGTVGTIPKYIGTRMIGNSTITDGSNVTVNNLFRTTYSLPASYSPAAVTPGMANLASISNPSNTDGVASLLNFTSSRAGGINSAVYLGALSGSVDYRSPFVFGRILGLSSWAESMRIDYDGSLLLGTTTNSGYKFDVNGTGRFSGALTVINGVNPTDAVNKSQLDLKITGTGTTNFLAKWTGTNTQDASNLFYDNTNLGIGETTGFNDVFTIKSLTPTMFGIYNNRNIATTVASAVLSLGQMSGTTKIPASDIAGFLPTVGDDANGVFRVRTRRAGVMTEVIRFHSSGGVSLGSATDPGTGNLSVTGNITAANLLSGTYTPTVANVANSGTITFGDATYTRVGNLVTVYFSLSMAVTSANTLTTFSITLPVNRTTTSNKGVGSGTAYNTIPSAGWHPISIFSDATTTAKVYFYPSVNTNTFSVNGSFQYLTTW